MYAVFRALPCFLKEYDLNLFIAYVSRQRLFWLHCEAAVLSIPLPVFVPVDIGEDDARVQVL